MAQVLIVDDSSTMRSVVRRSVLMAGTAASDIAEAKDGAAALEAIAESMPALVLCDVNMPRLTGTEFLQELQSRYGYDMPKVVMVTSVANAKTLLQLIRFGATKIIRKPFDPNALATEVRALLPPVEPEAPVYAPEPAVAAPHGHEAAYAMGAEYAHYAPPAFDPPQAPHPPVYAQHPAAPHYPPPPPPYAAPPPAAYPPPHGHAQAYGQPHGYAPAAAAYAQPAYAYEPPPPVPESYASPLSPELPVLTSRSPRAEAEYQEALGAASSAVGPCPVSPRGLDLQRLASVTGSAVREVLETMAFAYVTSVDDEIPSDRVMYHVSIPFTGVSAGRLSMAAPAEVATNLAISITGADPGTNDAQRLDAVAELANVVIGELARQIPAAMEIDQDDLTFGLPETDVWAPGRLHLQGAQAFEVDTRGHNLFVEVQL